MDDGTPIDHEDLGSAHTRAREVRGEVLTGPERRRRWSLEEKLRILGQSVAPGYQPRWFVGCTGSAAASFTRGGGSSALAN